MAEFYEYAATHPTPKRSNLSAKAKSVLYAILNGGSGCPVDELVTMVDIPAVDEHAVKGAAHQLWLYGKVERRWLRDEWHYWMIGQAPNTTLGHAVDGI